MTTFDITVVVPTVGRSSLARCLASIGAQSDIAMRAVLVVDNRRDLSASPLVLPRLNGCCVQYCREPHPSVGAARMRGLVAAETKWVAFTDDDCVVPRNWVAGIKEYLEQHPECAVAGGLVDEPHRAGLLYEFMRRINYMSHARRVKYRPGGIPSLGAANLVVDRESALQIGGFNRWLASTEDYEFLVRARAANYRIGIYENVPPIVHEHETDVRRFLSRYCGYGRGVAQTVRLHGLDAEGHRIYVRRGLPSLPRAAWRFAREDLSTTRQTSKPIRPSIRLAHAALAGARAVAWQYGAWLTVHRKERG